MTSTLPQHDITDIRREASRLSIWKECCRLEALNWTPWWGGDFEAKVRDPHTLRPTSAPKSESLKGVIRWILRLALSAHMSGGHSDLDNALAYYLGGVGAGGHGDQLDSLVRIRVKARITSDVHKVRHAAVMISNPHKLPNLRKAYNMIGSAVGNAAYAKLLTVSRYILLGLGRSSQKRKSLLPVAPGHVRLTVSIDVKKISGVNFEVLCKLVSYATIYALQVRGLGRGATRGFGRFRILTARNREFYCNLQEREQKEIIDIAEKLLDPAHVKEAIQQIHTILIELVHSLVRQENSSGSREKLVPSLKPLSTPSPCNDGETAGVYVTVIRGAKHPAPVLPADLSRYSSLRTLKKPIKDVYDALSAIGAATTKATWKLGSNMRVTSPGIGFHTWILGFPRYNGRAKTGYVLSRSPCLGAEGSQRCRDNCCLEKHRVRGGGERRQSPIMLYPMPEDPATIVLVAYLSIEDHAKLLRENSGQFLYHVGMHDYNPKRNHGQPPCRHVVSVSYSSGLPSVDTPPQECYFCDNDNRRTSWGCGKDAPAGILYPLASPWGAHALATASSPGDIVCKAFEASVDHIRNALS